MNEKKHAARWRTYGSRWWTFGTRWWTRTMCHGTRVPRRRDRWALSTTSAARRGRRAVLAAAVGASALAVLGLPALTAPAGAAGSTGLTGPTGPTGSSVAGVGTAPAVRPATAGASRAPAGGTCATGQLCLWQKPGFEGARQVHELSEVPIDSCIALPGKGTAQSLANRTGRPVTTYQSEECAETGEFETYPGDGTWTPQSPYLVRAFKVWER